MFKVQCTGCQASYNVDERRVPDLGMKMRCPKCTTTFVVKRPEVAARASDPDLPAPLADLPATKGAAAAGAPKKGPPRPAPRRTMPMGAVDLDLAPPPRPSKAAAPDDDELDLSLGDVPGRAVPEPPGLPRMAGPSFAEIDLPAVQHAGVDLPAVQRGGADLPARRRTGGALFDDLPSPSGGGPDLPSPVGGLDLPTFSGGGLDLPSPAGGLDLPSFAGGDVGLPSPAANLPVPAGRGFDFDLPSPAASLPAVGGVGLPTPAAGLPTPQAGLPSPANVGLPAAPADPFADFGEAPLGGGAVAPEGFGDDPFGVPAPRAATGSAPSVPAPPPELGFGEMDFGEPPPGPSERPPPESPNAPSRAGGLGWGERDLGGGDEDMEFGAIPQEGGPARQPSEAPPAAGASRVVAVQTPRRLVESSVAPPPTSTRRLKIGVGVGIAILALGVGMMATPYGAFGVWLVHDAVKAKGWRETLDHTTKACRVELSKDTAGAAARASEIADGAAQANDRARELAAYAAYVNFYRQVRFGRDPQLAGRAKAQMSSVPADRSGSPFDLARAAQAVAGDQLPRGLVASEGLARRAGNDVDAVSLAGEAALSAKEADKALAHFTKLATLEPAVRALFGQARAQLLKGDRDKAEALAKQVADGSPNHAGARLLLARLTWDASHDEATTMAYVDAVLKKPETRAAASSADLVAAYTLVGEISLRRSRVGAAESAFGEALKLDPRSSPALAGLGEALYRAGRQAEALARFTAAIEADPEAIVPKVGLAKTQIALERVTPAKDLLRGLAKKLKDAGKPSPLVLSWLGRAEEATGDRVSAEASYNEAIKLAGADSDIVDTYVSLTNLLLSLGRPAEAAAKLEEARAKLPMSVHLHKALGDIAFTAGRYDEAERQYLAALAMDEHEIATRFKLGVTERRLGKFDAASEALDKVAAADKDYPGLSLERAVLFEASGQAQKALEMYEAALAKAPDDPDLMLRVAAAQVSAGKENLGRAEELLRKVLQLRPNNGEVQYYMGRVLLAKGTSLAEALRYFERAADLDPNRAEYFLYVGWAANDSDQQGKAEKALDRCLELDKSLADAYWQRGILRRRQRLVNDAEADLKKALELRPSRFEAYATLAEVYEDQQRWPAAQDAWAKAIAQDGKRADWRFRAGRLLMQLNNKAGALEHLTQAYELAMASEVRPSWLSECARLLAEAELAAGKREAAIQHYQQYVSLAPPTSAYIKDACRALKAHGATARGCN